MPQQPAPGVARVILQYVLFNQIVQNVLHFEKSAGSAFTETELDELHAAVALAWSTHIRPLVSGDVRLDKIIITDLTSIAGLSKEWQITINNVGGVPAAALPGSVTLSVKWVTALRGRSFRGRTYHVGLNPAQVTGNTMVAVTRGQLEDAYNDFKDAINALISPAGSLVVLSRYGQGIERPVPLSTPVTSALVDQNVDNQRRRLAGRGM